MLVPRDKIRPVIKEISTIRDIQALINNCFELKTEKEDREFIVECLSEIDYRKKENLK